MVQSWLSPTVKTRPSVFDRVKLEVIKVERLISLVMFRFFVTVSSVAFNGGQDTQSADVLLLCDT